MSDYAVVEILPSDIHGNQEVIRLLECEGIRRDANLDYTCGIYDENLQLAATGSCFGNTLRCLAVSNSHQGEGLMNQIISHLVMIQAERGNTHLFLYTKCESSHFFENLGFYEIARIKNQIVFMENRRSGFSNYLNRLKKETEASSAWNSFFHENTSSFPRNSAIVMNANPFTLGHQYLVEKASAENDIVHLFLVSEDTSLIPFTVRKNLVLKGISHLKNIVCHDSDSYIISNATFPSYFQRDTQAVMESHAYLDLTVFTLIAKFLSINRRYVGEEPFSQVTALYNQIMKQKLPEQGIECIEIPRKKAEGQIISASSVRQAIKEGDQMLLARCLPTAVLDYFHSPDAREILQRISVSSDVIHH